MRYLPGGIPWPSAPVARNVPLFPSYDAAYVFFGGPPSAVTGKNVTRTYSSSGTVKGAPPLSTLPVTFRRPSPPQAAKMNIKRMGTRRWRRWLTKWDLLHEEMHAQLSPDTVMPSSLEIRKHQLCSSMLLRTTLTLPSA